MNIALCLYVAALLGVASALHLAGDRWWVATVLLFAPRWIWGLPLCAFALFVAVAQRRLLWPLALALAIWVGPIMGLCVPWRTVLRSSTPAWTLRVLTCNNDSQALDPGRLRALVGNARPTIVILQDVWTPHLRDVFASDDWHLHVHEGMCVASRYPILAVEMFESDAFGPHLGRAARYTLQTPLGIIHVLNLHLATPRWGLLAAVGGERRGAEKLQGNSDLRRRQSKLISQRASKLAGPVLVAGDFNTPIESTVYRACWSAYNNAFSTAGLGCGNTHRTEHTAVRIDHILASRQWRVRRCWVGPDVGSAHRPVVAEFAWDVPQSRGESMSRRRSAVIRR